VTEVSLTSKQRAHLRSLAHSLKPVVHIGHEGVTESLVASVLEAFNQRELLKVRVLETSPQEVREAANALVEAIPDAHVAQMIGRIAVLYRPDPEEPEIRLPG